MEQKKYTVGIDLGGTNIAVGLCDEELNIIDKDSVPTLAERPTDYIVKDMADLTAKILERNGVTLDDVNYVGIAAPGTVNYNTGMIEYSNNIKMVDYPICKVFKSFLPVEKVYVANDANAAAFGESLAGASKGANVSVMLTLGTGVGGGVVMNGKIYDGSVNCAGVELGHMVIVSRGRQCSCGRRGCLEAYASATALIRATEEKMYELKIKGIDSLLFDEAEKRGVVDGRTPFDAMKAGDPYAKDITDEYLYYLAEGISNLINIFQPDVLCIGGGVCNQGDSLLLPIITMVDRDQYTRLNIHKTRIKIAKLGNDAGIIGAAGIGRMVTM